MEPLLQYSSIHIYNKSHVPAYTHFARTNEHQLGEAAEKVIKSIADIVPEVLKIHITDLTKDLQHSQPTASKPGASASTVNALKACANYARRFASEMTKERSFYQAMIAYALYGSPDSAKHAVTIIDLAAPNKILLLEKIASDCVKNFRYGADQFNTRLAALAQLRLVANEETDALALNLRLRRRSGLSEELDTTLADPDGSALCGIAGGGYMATFASWRASVDGSRPESTASMPDNLELPIDERRSESRGLR